MFVIIIIPFLLSKVFETDNKTCFYVIFFRLTYISVNFYLFKTNLRAEIQHKDLCVISCQHNKSRKKYIMQTFRNSDNDRKPAQLYITDIVSSIWNITALVEVRPSWTSNRIFFLIFMPTRVQSRFTHRITPHLL